MWFGFMTTANQIARTVPRPISQDSARRLARRWLIAFSIVVGVATTTGTLAYCYPRTLGPLRPWNVWLHEISGDAAVLFSIGYLMVHLPRVWRFKRFVVSRWSGFVLLGIWGAAGLTGLWGQLMPLEAGSWTWLVHVWASVLCVVLGCFHGLWALRPSRSGEA